MKYSNPAPVDNASAFRRFMTTLTLDPQKAILFWCIMGVLLFTLIFGGCFALVGAGNAAITAAKNADIKVAPLQTATAVVESKTPWSGNTKNWNNAGLMLNMHINGRAAFTPAIIDERTFGVQIGDRIQVKYRVGKSNTIYIEDWQPLPR